LPFDSRYTAGLGGCASGNAHVDVAAWLQELGLERYEAAFREADIAPAILPELTDRDLAELGVAPSHRRLLLKAIRALSPDPVDHRQENAALHSPARRTQRSPRPWLPDPHSSHGPSGGS
jgi:hypothetical protein